jgi:hypothetical protein
MHVGIDFLSHQMNDTGIFFVFNTEQWIQRKGNFMGYMTVPSGSGKPAGTKPLPKSKNKKSLGPSLKASSGTGKTQAGSKKGKAAAGKAGKNVAPKAAGEKKGTVYRSSKESQGKRPVALARTKKAAGSASKPAMRKKPVSKSRGKNSSVSSSRPSGQRWYCAAYSPLKQLRW